MPHAEEVATTAQACAQGLIAADAKITMAGKEPKEMKEIASSTLNSAMPAVKGGVEAIETTSAWQRDMETETVDVLALRAVSLAAFATPIGPTTKGKK